MGTTKPWDVEDLQMKRWVSVTIEGGGDCEEVSEPLKIYGHGNDGYMKDHVVAIYEEGDEVTDGWKIVMWAADDVGENALWRWEDHGDGRRLVSVKYPSHCIAVYETGDGVAGDKVVLWNQGDVGNNALWHKKKHRMFSHRNGGEDHVFAVMEEGDGPNGFQLCTWPRDDTGKNAKFHYKSEDTSSDSD